jgi:DNA-binding response OmpR family regulator
MRVHIVGFGRRRSEAVLRNGLTTLGFEVVAEADADRPDGTRRLSDAVLLDCGVVDAEVLAYCTRLKQQCGAPVLAITHRVDLAAWLRGREAGIDDFLVQPFGLEELAARLRLAVRPVHRRQHPPGPRRIAAGPVVISEDSRTVAVHGQPVELRPKEYQVLVVLARQAGTVLGRDQLIARVWPAGWDGAGRALEVHVASLRAKLGVPGVITTVRGVGYRMASQDSFMLRGATAPGRDVMRIAA